MELSTYLFFNGNCKEAFQFYEQALKGKIELMMTYRESPEKNQECTPTNPDGIMHVRLTVGKHALMGSDSPPQYYSKPQGFSVSYTAADQAEAERAFKALSQDGSVTMPLGKTFWSEAFGMCTDRFGINWMVNCAN